MKLNKLIFYPIFLFMVSIAGCDILGSEDNTPPSVDIIFPKENETYYNTGKSFDLVAKISDAEKNAEYLYVHNNGQLDFFIPEGPKYYDDEPDTFKYVNSVIYPFNMMEGGATVLNINVTDRENSSSENIPLNFNYELEQVTLKNIKLTPFGVPNVSTGDTPVNVSFDVSAASGDLKSIISFVITHKDEQTLFGFYENTYQFDCNTCGTQTDYPALTSHFEADIAGKFGQKVFLYIRVHGYGASSHLIKYELGVIE